MKKNTFNFWETFRAANLTVIKDKNDWILMAVGPWLLVLVAFLITIVFGVDPNLEAGEIPQNISALTGLPLSLSFLLNLVALVIFQIRTLRYKLLGDLPQSFISLEWKMRHWKMIGNSILVALAVGIPTGIFFGIGAYLTINDNIGLGIIFILLGIATLIYIAARLYLFSPVVAIDGTHPLKTSWNLTTGWTWLKFLALAIIVALPAALVLNIISMILGMAINMWVHIAISSLFTTFVLNIILMSAIASIYKQLSSK